MRPVRRRDRQNRDVLKNLFRRKDNAALVDPKEDYMTDDSGRPILNLLPEAEVAGAKTQYKEADLAESALRGGALAGREALGLVPVVGEALDLAELNKIVRTGKDFYEDEADPKMYAGMTAAGMLLPNIIERPFKALGRGAKKLFKFGKKSPNPSSDKVVKKERRHSNFTEGSPAKLGKIPDGDYDAVESIQQHVTNTIRRKGEKLDELGFDPSNLTMENIMRKGMTSKESGRHVVEVDLGNGMSQHFYLSTGLGGKTPVKGGTSKGIWVPYEGTTDVGKDVLRDYEIDDWVVKGKGWDHGYGSKTMHDISTKLSDLLKDEDFVQDVLQKYYAGGVITMRKKKKGMSPIRK
jgi:hypothetical protein